jgi:tripartite-type tricarboxylate transporter receptor subunit TctC
MVWFLKKRGLGSCALICAVILSNTAYAQISSDWPSKTIKVVVPYPPGAATDTIKRIVMEKLATRLKQNIVVENKPGANSSVGTTLVARSEPDGYTFLSVLAAYSINPHLYKLPYTADALIPVAKMADLPNFLYVSNTLPVNTIEELLAYGRNNPGKLNYASSGTGSSAHMMGASLALRSGIKMEHVPYKGTAPILTDLLSGEVSMVFSSMVVFMPHVKEGKLKAIALSFNQRWPTEPNIPTVAESGFPGFSIVSWSGLLAPKGTDPAITTRMASEIYIVLQDPDGLAKFAKGGLIADFQNAEQFGNLINQDSKMYGEIIQQANIRLN